MRRWLVAFTPAVTVWALDRVTKIAVERTIALYETHRIIPGFFNLVHSRNQGAAFGMFAGSSSPYRPVLLVGVTGLVLAAVALLLVRIVAGKTAGGTAARWGLSLVLGHRFPRVLRGQVRLARFQRGRRRDHRRRTARGA